MSIVFKFCVWFMKLLHLNNSKKKMYTLLTFTTWSRSTFNPLLDSRSTFSSRSISLMAYQMPKTLHNPFSLYHKGEFFKSSWWQAFAFCRSDLQVKSLVFVFQARIQLANTMCCHARLHQRHCSKRWLFLFFFFLNGAVLLGWIR